MQGRATAYQMSALWPFVTAALTQLTELCQDGCSWLRKECIGRAVSTPVVLKAQEKVIRTSAYTSDQTWLFRTLTPEWRLRGPSSRIAVLSPLGRPAVLWRVERGLREDAHTATQMAV